MCEAITESHSQESKTTCNEMKGAAEPRKVVNDQKLLTENLQNQEMLLVEHIKD